MTLNATSELCDSIRKVIDQRKGNANCSPQARPASSEDGSFLP